MVPFASNEGLARAYKERMERAEMRVSDAEKEVKKALAALQAAEAKLEAEKKNALAEQKGWEEYKEYYTPPKHWKAPVEKRDYHVPIPPESDAV